MDHRTLRTGVGDGPIGCRQHQRERAAHSDLARQPHGAAVRFGDVSDQREPDANPADPGTSVVRNSAITEPHFNADVRLTRRFGLGGDASMEAVAEVFNVFNNVNFVQPIALFGPGAFPDHPLVDASGRSSYGLYQKALAPRQVQFALKLAF